jgi:aminoglycoside 6'-N-acetyltransferase I
MIIRPLQPADFDAWVAMRHALWPDHEAEELRDDAARMRAGDPTPYIKIMTYVAEDGGRLYGFLEASLRGCADRCCSSPVGYIEGWYVTPEKRGKGIGSALVQAAENWARGEGCMEMASDAHADNDASRKAHRALGYDESRPVVQFRKTL